MARLVLDVLLEERQQAVPRLFLDGLHHPTTANDGVGDSNHVTKAHVQHVF